MFRTPIVFLVHHGSGIPCEIATVQLNVIDRTTFVRESEFARHGTARRFAHVDKANAIRIVNFFLPWHEGVLAEPLWPVTVLLIGQNA